MRGSGSANGTSPALLCLGDSLTEGWGLPPGGSLPSVLLRELAANGLEVDVVNAGLSGDTAAGGLARLAPILATEGPFHAALVQFGANDWLMGRDPADVERDLDQIMTRLFRHLARHEKTPGQNREPRDNRPANIVLAGVANLVDHPPGYARRFTAIYPRLAEKFSVPLVPDILSGILGEPSLTLPDGLHPNQDGVAAMAKAIVPHLAAMFRA